MSPASFCVALNGRFSGTPQPTGTQTASYQLFDAIIRGDRDFEIVVFADPRFADVSAWAEIPKTRLVSVPFQDWSRGRAHVWEQLQFPWLCRKYRCAVAHHPMTTCPSFPGKIPAVVTLHDLNFLLHPEWYSASFRRVYDFCALPGLRRATRVVTISNYVQGQAIQHLGLDVDKVRRIYNGARAPGQEGSGSSTHSPSYILCVGSLQPHKNLPRLIRAYLQLRSSFPALELWVIGRAQPRFAEQPELSALLESPGVRRLGYLSEMELGEAYRRAAVFCYPSLEEGFGLPVLEAMLCGTPVVTSSVSCLPEIAGPEAVLVDPTNENHLAEALHRVLEWSPEELNRRKQISSGWAREFNWEKSAQDYYQLYHELAGIPLPPNPKIG